VTNIAVETRRGAEPRFRIAARDATRELAGARYQQAHVGGRSGAAAKRVRESLFDHRDRDSS